MADKPKTDREIFEAALDIPDAEQRAAFLLDACVNAPEQQARLGNLLAAHDAAGDFMSTPARADQNPTTVIKCVPAQSELGL